MKVTWRTFCPHNMCLASLRAGKRELRSAMEATEDDLPWLGDVEFPILRNIVSPTRSVEPVGTTGRGDRVAIAEVQRMYTQHEGW
jgi:hypothetical protein